MRQSEFKCDFPHKNFLVLLFGSGHFTWNVTLHGMVTLLECRIPRKMCFFSYSCVFVVVVKCNKKKILN